MTAIINDQDLTSLNSEGYLYIKNFLSVAELSPLMNKLTNLAAAFGSDVESTAAFGGNVDEAFVNIIKNKGETKAVVDSIGLILDLKRFTWETGLSYCVLE